MASRLTILNLSGSTAITTPRLTILNLSGTTTASTGSPRLTILNLGGSIGSVQAARPPLFCCQLVGGVKTWVPADLYIRAPDVDGNPVWVPLNDLAYPQISDLPPDPGSTIVPISGYGSSTMFGQYSGGLNLLYWLGLDLSSPTFNGAEPGEYAGHAAARANAIPALLTVTNNTIPASGSVIVTAHNFETNAGSATAVIPGKLGGVQGTLTWAAVGTGQWKFNRTVAGTAVTISASSPFTADFGVTHRGDRLVLNIGKNNARQLSSVTPAINAVAAMVAHMSAATPQYIVMGNWCDADMTPTGLTAARARVMALNDSYATRYGIRYADVAAYLASSQLWADTGITPNAADLTAQANGVLPLSIAGDPPAGRHLSPAGYKAVERAVLLPKAYALGWQAAQTEFVWVSKIDPALLGLANAANVTTVAPAPGSLQTGALTSSTGTAPTFRTNVLNGKPVIRFAGASSLDSGAWATAYNPPRTEVAVWKRNVVGTSQNVMAGRGTKYLYMGANGTGSLVAGAGTPNQLVYQPTAETWFIQLTVFDGAQSRMYVNKSKAPAVTGTTGTDPLTAGLAGYRLGSNSAGTGVFLTGDIALAGVIDRALTQAQVETLMAQLRATYALGGLGIGPLGLAPLGL